MRKKKDDGLRAIICLAVATVVVGGASIVVSNMDETPTNLEQTVDGTNGTDKVISSAESNGATKLDITGANAKIKEAYKNTDGTYTVVVSEEGYIGEIVIEAVYSEDGKTLVSYDVLSHTETPDLGSKVDEDDYKALLAGVTLPVTANGLDISGILGIKAEEPEVAEQVTFHDGTYTAQTKANENGDYSYVTVTVEDGKVTNVVWDEITGGASKAELSATGKYVMKPVWKTQSESLGAYVVEHQKTEGIMNDQNRTDVVSGVSIKVDGFVSLVNQAIADANGNDGEYTATTETAEDGSYSYATVIIADGKITNVVWDEVTAQGSKIELSANGQYVMKPIWKTQSESVGNYVVEHQSTAGIANENGYTDVVSGVSINIAGFVDLANEALVKASSTFKDGTYTVKSTEEDAENYQYVTVTVEGGKVTNVVWDEITGGASKAELSANGQYVMKPVWKTQSESLGAYVVEHQKTEGIMNDQNRTDVVSGVSIKVDGFVSLVNQAIADANGNDGEYTATTETAEDGSYSYATVTIADGKITNVVWDEITAQGSKIELSANGQYVMKPIWKTQSESVGNYVVENQSTTGIANEKGYTDVVSGVSINIAGFVDLANQALAKASSNVSLKDGTYTVKSTEEDAENYSYATVTIVDGKITSVVWDEITGGASKAELSATGQYVMKPIWKTQSESLGAYVVENQTTDGIMNESGYTDVVSGVSIYVGGFVDLTNQAIEQAVGTNKSISGADGTYTAQTEPNENGEYSYSTVTIENGKITSVVWDEITKDGAKSELSVTGQYVMKPVWKTQSESLGAYVVENQTTDGIMNDKGYTDVVSGVSINIAGFVDLTNQAIAKASETGEIPSQVSKPEIDATKVDVISGATFSSKAVIRAIDEGFVFLRDFILN